MGTLRAVVDRDTQAEREQGILADLKEWQGRFLAGELRSKQLFRRPNLHEGERFAVQITHVGYAPPGGRLVSDSWITGNRLGSAWATSERLLVADAGKIKYEWAWSDVRWVKVLPQWNGVVFDLGKEYPAMLCSQPPPTGRPPSLAQLAGWWLRVEGAFESYSGRLDAWMETLGFRLAAEG